VLLNEHPQLEKIASSVGAYKILSLDGGGAKGFYTIGVLKELEALLGNTLADHFDLIFGTSTGAIIAALIALGYKVDDVHGLYKEHVPSIMAKKIKRTRSKALGRLASAVFGNGSFTDFKTDIGIVATRWAFEKPMIFKARVQQAHGRQATFVPGFGCSIAEAVKASCSAYPFFEKTRIRTNRGENVDLIDGGYCANNPTLYAIADAVSAMGRRPSDLRVLSVGVGSYPEPKGFKRLIKKHVWSLLLLQKTLDVNTNSMEQLRSILFRDVPTVRVNETYEIPEMATDLMEHDLEKLSMLYQRGGESYGKHEQELKLLFGKQ
jgi:uncharacterized protein